MSWSMAILSRLLVGRGTDHIRDVQVLRNVPHKRCIIGGTLQDPREVPAVTRRQTRDLRSAQHGRLCF
jgi:hypothetical protein